VSERADARLDSLTGIRFFAAFGVFLCHAIGSGHSGYARVPALYPYNVYGNRGVALFFVLSGLVLTWTWRPQTSNGRFYRKRVARIMPMHVVTTVAALFVFYRPFTHQVFDGSSYLLSVVLLQGWLPPSHLTPMFPGNSVSWTLSCEAFFYLMFPFVIRPLSRLSSRQLVAMAAGAVCLALTWKVYATNTFSGPVGAWTLRHPVFRFWEFFLGIVLGLLLQRGVRLPGRVWMAVLAIAAWVIIYHDVRPHVMPFDSDPLGHLDQVMAPLLFAWLLGVAAGQDLRGRRGVLASKPLVLLGLWSYAFYLVQFFPLTTATHIWGQQSPSNGNIVDVLVLAAITVALAALMYYVVERPMERWVRDWSPRRRRVPEPPDPALDAETRDSVSVLR